MASHGCEDRDRQPIRRALDQSNDSECIHAQGIPADIVVHRCLMQASSKEKHVPGQHEVVEPFG